MTTNKNKFRQKGKTSKFFPIVLHRFRTEKHPVMTSSKKAAKKVRVMLSLNEKRMVEGMSEMFSCSLNEAIRVACYEMREDIPLMFGEDAKSNPKKGRGQKFNLSIPAAELEKVADLASQFELTPAELIRCALIGVSKGIREGQIKTITKSPKRRQNDLAREWSEAQPYGRKGTIQHLRDARQASWEVASEAYRDAWEAQRLRYQKVGEEMTRISMEAQTGGSMAAFSDGMEAFAQARLEIEAEDAFDAMTCNAQGKRQKSSLTDYYEFEMGMTHAEALECAQFQLDDEEQDDLSDEEMDAIMSEMGLENL